MQDGGVLDRLAQWLARWLRGLALRLESVAGGPAVPQPLLAALAERFPGAPEHWLADIARHMIEGDEPLPGMTSAVPQTAEAPPAHSPRPVAAKPVETARRPRPALRLIGSDSKRRPLAEQPESTHHKRPAGLRWIGSPPKTGPTVKWPELPASARHQARFETGMQHSAAPSPSVPIEFREAERIANLFPAPGRCPPDLPELPIVHRFVDHSVVFSRDGSRQHQNAEFPASPPPGGIEPAAGLDGPVSVRIPVEFAPLRPAQRVSLAFPQGRQHRGGGAWSDTPGDWPALPTHEQQIEDAPSPSSPINDIVREQMSGRWSA